MGSTLSATCSTATLLGPTRCRLADNLPYFSKDMDLCLAYNMEEGTMESIQIEYLNLINLMYAFKKVRNMEMFLEGNVHAHDGVTELSRSSPARP
jgi:hypothetical protein